MYLSLKPFFCGWDVFMCLSHSSLFRSAIQLTFTPNEIRDISCMSTSFWSFFLLIFMCYFTSVPYKNARNSLMKCGGKQITTEVIVFAVTL